jgi:hypothetical protein
MSTSVIGYGPTDSRQDKHDDEQRHNLRELKQALAGGHTSTLDAAIANSQIAPKKHSA